MSSVTKEEVSRLARLAHIRLTDEQVVAMQQELSAILELVAQLGEETDSLEPTYQVNGVQNVTRPDELIDYGVSPEALLSGVPATENGSIKVPRVL